MAAFLAGETPALRFCQSPLTAASLREWASNADDGEKAGVFGEKVFHLLEGASFFEAIHVVDQQVADAIGFGRIVLDEGVGRNMIGIDCLCVKRFIMLKD